VGVNRTDLLTV